MQLFISWNKVIKQLAFLITSSIPSMKNIAQPPFLPESTCLCSQFSMYLPYGIDAAISEMCKTRGKVL
jgi:hypothetical protein